MATAAVELRGFFKQAVESNNLAAAQRLISLVEAIEPSNYQDEDPQENFLSKLLHDSVRKNHRDMSLFLYSKGAVMRDTLPSLLIRLDAPLECFDLLLDFKWDINHDQKIWGTALV